MHDSFKRLLDAARHPASLRRADTAADVGRILSQSPQTITNWKASGVSQRGALAAEASFGCSASWLLTGDGEMHPSRHQHRLVVAEPPPRSFMPAWPFPNVDPASVAQLQPEQIAAIEATLLAMGASPALSKTAAAA